MDPNSDRGDRTVGEGIITPEGIGLLNGFNFNEKAPVSSILFSDYSVDTASGEISFDHLITADDLKTLPGASHISLTSGWACVNFDEGTYDSEFSASVILPVNSSQVSNIQLTPASTPSGQGTNLFLLLVEYFQEINGTRYSLKNGAYNVLTIVNVM